MARIPAEEISLFSANAQQPQAQNYPDRMPNPEGGSVGLSIRTRLNTSLINLRAEDKIKAKIKKLFGTALPKAANKMTAIGTRRALWLGPDETLLIFDEAQEAELMLSIKDTLNQTHYAATLISDAYHIFQLTGPHIRDVLSKGCSLDLHESAFISGDCAQTGLGQAAVTLAAEEDGSFLLICRTSFADYISSWLKDAAIEYGYVTAGPR